MTSKKKTSSKPSLPKLKKKLWEKYFSPYIKLKYSPDGINVSCYTCGRNLRLGTSDCHGGHWLTRAYNYHFFNEDNVRPQCYDCNINKNGNSAVFERKLYEEIGSDKVEEMFDTRNLPAKRDRIWYEEMIEKYAQKLAEERRKRAVPGNG